MRSFCFALSLALCGCRTIHTIDLGAGRTALGAECNVPMNRGGEVPSGWAEIGWVQIDGASDWTEAQFAEEFREQACEMGAEYVVVSGTNEFMAGRFLVQQGASTGAAAQEGAQRGSNQAPAPQDGASGADAL